MLSSAGLLQVRRTDPSVGTECQQHNTMEEELEQLVDARMTHEQHHN